MRILLATDGSNSCKVAVDEICKRPWPAGTRVKIISVAPVLTLAEADPYRLLGAAIHSEMIEKDRAQAAHVVESTAEEIRSRAPELHVETETFDGSPKQVIVEEAERWEADLIILGSHGHGPVKRFLLGSTAQSVALHAHCSVEIARIRPPKSEE